MDPKSGSGGLGSMMRVLALTDRWRCTPRMAFLANLETRRVVLKRLVEAPDASASIISSSSWRRCSAALRLSDELELLGAEGEGLDLGEGPDGARGEREVGGGLGVERPGEQLLPAEVPLLELAGPGCRSPCGRRRWWSSRAGPG